MATMREIGIYLGVIGFAAIMVILVDLTTRRRVRRLLAGRAALTDEEFGATFFPGRQDVAARIRRIMATVVGIDLGGALPSDRFIEDLRIEEIGSLLTVEIIIDVEREFGIAITDEDAQRILTVGQLVDCVASKLDAQKGLPPGELHRLWDRELDM